MTMSIIRKMRKEKCVYWAHNGDDPSGQPKFDDPVECDCRWEERVEEMVDAQGRTYQSRALVYMDRPVTLGGRLWYGLLEDLEDQEDPEKNEGVFEIRGKGRMPDIKADQFMYTAYL